MKRISLLLVLILTSLLGGSVNKFVSQPLNKLMNRQNVVSRIEKLEAKTGPQPSATIGNLSELSPDAGDQFAGTYYVVDQATGAIRGYFTATPNEQFPGYYLAFFDSAGVFQFGVNADDGSAVAGAGAVTLDADGISVVAGPSLNDVNSYKFYDDTHTLGRLSAAKNVGASYIGLYAFGTPGLNSTQLIISNTPSTDSDGLLYISLDGETTIRMSKTGANYSLSISGPTVTISGTTSLTLGSDVVTVSGPINGVTVGFGAQKTLGLDQNRNTTGTFSYLEQDVLLHKTIQLDAVLWDIRIAGDYTLTIYDWEGNTLSTVAVSGVSAGSADVVFSTSNLNLTSGRYKFRLTKSASALWSDYSSSADQLYTDFELINNGRYDGTAYNVRAPFKLRYYPATY